MRNRSESIIALRDGLGVEGVGLNDVGAGFEIRVVDLADDVRLGQHEQVVVALEVAWVILEARATIACLVELIALNHGAHGAVEDQDALLRLSLQRGDAFVPGHCAASALGVAVETGRKPKRWQMA